MAYRTGTYFAFDGLGETNPANSDFKYYTAVQGWSAGKNIEFKFVNSHEKTSAVRDTSKLSTLKARIRERLAASKNIVVIISQNTRKSGSMLSYEIESAVDTYSLPLIIAYTGYNSILSPNDPALRMRWSNSLMTRIDNRIARAIHIPFKKDAILDSINQFTVNSNGLTGPLSNYSCETQMKWGYI